MDYYGSPPDALNGAMVVDVPSALERTDSSLVNQAAEHFLSHPKSCSIDEPKTGS